MKRPIMWSMLIALCIILGLVGLAAAQQPRYGGTLHVAWEQDVTGFDPHWSAGLQNIYLAGNLFNGLVTVDERLDYVPDLAESWEVQDNGKVMCSGCTRESNSTTALTSTRRTPEVHHHDARR